MDYPVLTNKAKEIVRAQIKDEFGKDPTDYHVELVMKDLWRKGCHHLELTASCRGCIDCPPGSPDEMRCPFIGWEKRNPEYKDDELAKEIQKCEKELSEMA